MSSVSQVILAGEKLTLFGNSPELPFDIAFLSRIAGPPSRTSQLENIVYTWDELGLLAYQAPAEPSLMSLSLCFGRREYDFTPRNAFAGTFLLNGSKLDATSPSSDLIAAGFRQDALLSFLYVRKQGIFEIIAEYREGLVNLSIDCSSD